MNFRIHRATTAFILLLGLFFCSGCLQESEQTPAKDVTVDALEPLPTTPPSVIATTTTTPPTIAYAQAKNEAETDKGEKASINARALLFPKPQVYADTAVYEENGELGIDAVNAGGERIVIKALSMKEILLAKKDCTNVKIAGVAVDRNTSYKVEPNETFRIDAKCPEAGEYSDFILRLRIGYDKNQDATKTNYTQEGDLRGVVVR